MLKEDLHLHLNRWTFPTISFCVCFLVAFPAGGQPTFADAPTDGQLMQQGYEKQLAKDFTGAIELYTQGLKAVPNNPAGWTSLGICYQAVDDFTNAYFSYKRAYCMDSNGQVANLYFIAVLGEHFGKGPEALNNYRTYIRQDPHGNYVALAQQRVDSLVRNIGATQRVHTGLTKTLRPNVPSNAPRSSVLDGNCIPEYITH